MKRLIWPGLLLVSLTANLFFACLCMYHKWGWTTDGVCRFRRTVAEWVALCRVSGPQSHSAMPEHITYPTGIYHSIQAQMSADRFSAAYLLMQWECVATVWWQQIWPDSWLLKIFGPCDLALFCLSVCCCSSYMCICAGITDFKGPSLALMLDSFSEAVLWNVQ